MKINQIEYQRSVIRDEYISRKDIDDRLAKGIVIPTSPGMRTEKRRRLERMGQKETIR